MNSFSKEIRSKESPYINVALFANTPTVNNTTEFSQIREIKEVKELRRYKNLTSES